MSKSMPYLLFAITLVVFVPIILLSYRFQKPVFTHYILGFINIGIAAHVLSTVDEASQSSDPQAGMGLGLYFVATLAAFAIFTIVGIVIFIYQMKFK